MTRTQERARRVESLATIGASIAVEWHARGIPFTRDSALAEADAWLRDAERRVPPLEPVTPAEVWRDEHGRYRRALDLLEHILGVGEPPVVDTATARTHGSLGRLARMYHEARRVLEELPAPSKRPTSNPDAWSAP